MSSKKDKTPPLLKFVRWIFPKLERFAPMLAQQYFIKIFFTPLRYPVPEKEKTAAAAAEKFFIEVDQQKIQCYKWGSKGPIVLLVHGWAGRATQFRKFISPLNKVGFTVVAFDGPAHGNSEGKKTNINEFKSVLNELYKQVGSPVGIIAHSFGGGAVLYSAMNGLEVKKLIMIASPTIGDKIIGAYLKAINGSWATGTFFKNYVQSTYGKPFEQFTSQYFVEHLRQEISLLLVYDRDDKEVELEHALEVQRKYPKAGLIITEGLGHTRILKEDNVIDQCVTFIQK